MQFENISFSDFSRSLCDSTPEHGCKRDAADKYMIEHNADNYRAAAYVLTGCNVLSQRGVECALADGSRCNERDKTDNNIASPLLR